MDFDLTPQEQAFADQVEKWLVENHDPAVMDPTRENFARGPGSRSMIAQSANGIDAILEFHGSTEIAPSCAR